MTPDPEELAHAAAVRYQRAQRGRTNPWPGCDSCDRSARFVSTPDRRWACLECRTWADPDSWWITLVDGARNGERSPAGSRA